MNTRELRIGNYVWANQEIAEITAIESIEENDVILQLNGKQINAREESILIEPMPLTLELVASCCGFSSKGVIVLGLNSFQQYLKLQDGYIMILNAEEKPTMHFWDVKYFHQLQNLYFILKGEELPIYEL